MPGSKWFRIDSLLRVYARIPGQKCSALSRLYVSSSVWANGFKDQLLTEVAKIKVGPARDFSAFMGPVMCVFISLHIAIITSSLDSTCLLTRLHFSGRPAFDKITGYIQKAKDAGGEVLVGGTGLAFPLPWTALSQSY